MGINTTDKEIEEYVEENGFTGSAYFVSPNYASAIMGISTNGNIIYSYEKMIEYLMITDDMNYSDAVEWLDYNVIGCLPYMSNGTPVIMYEVE